MKSGERAPLSRAKDSGRTPSPQAAIDLAGAALAFLADDMERLERFFALTGLDPADVRGLVGSRGFCLAVLDHVAQDERCLVLFAEASGVAPEAIGAARRALGGGDY